MINKTILFF